MAYAWLPAYKTLMYPDTSSAAVHIEENVPALNGYDKSTFTLTPGTATDRIGVKCGGERYG